MQWLPRLMGIVPFGIGLTVLGFLWGAPFGEFGSPPLPFRIFGSFIALAFVLVGVGFFTAGGLVGKLGSNSRMMNLLQQQAARMHRQSRRNESSDESTPPQVGYDCPNCGASLGENPEVSPSGDAKCSYCKRWFNIHQS